MCAVCLYDTNTDVTLLVKQVNLLLMLRGVGVLRVCVSLTLARDPVAISLRTPAVVQLTDQETRL